VDHPGRVFVFAIALGGLGALGVSACGGRVDDVEGTSVDGVTSTEKATLGCTAACRSLSACAALDEDHMSCVDRCARDFGPAAAQEYAACVGAISCEKMRLGRYGGFGPLADCRARTHRK
jgi:hypothetical protein